MTLKQRLFVDYYLGKAQGNGTLAARLAGYRKPMEQAYENLRKPQIAEAIAAKVSAAGMEADEVLARLADRGRATIDDYIIFDPDAGPDDPPSIDLRKARRKGSLGNTRKIKQSTRIVEKLGPNGNVVARVTERDVDLEIHDALPALALLARFHGLAKPQAPEDEDGYDATAEIRRRLVGLLDGRGSVALPGVSQ